MNGAPAESTNWSAGDVKDLMVRWARKQSASTIAAALGRSRNAVLSKAKRLGITEANLIAVPAARRVGQAGFRLRVLAAYKKCCMSGAEQPQILEAAHIIPYSVSSNHEVSNGLALRVDLHCLFDAGLICVSEELHVIVSPAVRDESYLEFAGRTIALPVDLQHYPSADAIAWHRENVFIDA